MAFTIMNITPQELEVNDLILGINGVPTGERIPVVDTGLVAATLKPLPSGITRTLYFDQVESVEVERETHGAVVLPPYAHSIISDSLLLMIETAESNGRPTTRTRETLRLLHVFSTPQAEVEILVRPKTTPSA